MTLRLEFTYCVCVRDAHVCVWMCKTFSLLTSLVIKELKAYNLCPAGSSLKKKKGEKKITQLTAILHI